jgi:hypothetical protein
VALLCAKNWLCYSFILGAGLIGPLFRLEKALFLEKLGIEEQPINSSQEWMDEEEDEDE